MIDLKKALFFDIETHRVVNWDNQPKPLQQAFVNHMFDPDTYKSADDHFSEVAGLYPLLSRVICIVFGYEAVDGFRTLEYHGTDEVEILKKSEEVFKAFQAEDFFLVGHNILGCDIPYMRARYIVNKLQVPNFINSHGVKPWNEAHVDSMNLWYEIAHRRESLEMICAALRVPCKTDEIGGGNLYTYDISEMPWDQLVHYCTQDVESNYQAVKQMLEYYDTTEE